MTAAAVRPLPGRAAVLAAQFHLVWNRDKWQLLALWASMALFAPTGYWAGMGGLAFFALFLAGIWAEFVWRNEPVGGRGYHDGMPVLRSRHALTRVTVGLFWLLIVVTLAVLPDLLFGFTPFHNLEAARPAYVPGWLLVAWPAALVTVYLLVAALVVSARRPVFWVSGFLGLDLIAMPILFMFRDHLAVLTPLFELWDTFNTGRFGLLDALLPGHWLSADLTRVYGRPLPTDPVNALPSLLWLGMAVIVLLVAVHCRKED